MTTKEKVEYKTSESRRNLVEMGVFNVAVNQLQIDDQETKTQHFDQFPNSLDDWTPSILSLYLIQEGAFGHKVYIESGRAFSKFAVHEIENFPVNAKNKKILIVAQQKLIQNWNLNAIIHSNEPPKSTNNSNLEKEKELNQIEKEISEKLEKEITEKIENEMREKMERELREKIEREVREKTQREQEKLETESRERVQTEQELRDKIEKEMREKIEREVREKTQREQEKSEKELRERVQTEQELREKIEKEMREEIEREVRKKVQMEKEANETLESSLSTERSVPIIKCDSKSDQSKDILTRPTFSGSDATPYPTEASCQLSPSSSDSSLGSLKEMPRNNSRESSHHQYKLKTKNLAKSDSISDFVQQHSDQRLKTKKEEKNEKDIVSTEDRSGGSPRRPSVPSPSTSPLIAKDSISITNSKRRSTASLEVSTSSSNVPNRPSSLPPLRPHAVSLGKSNMTTSSPRNEFNESTTTPTTTAPTKPPVRPHSSPPSRPLLHLPPLDDTPISTIPTKFNLLPKAISTIGMEYSEGGSTGLKIEKKKVRASRSLSPKSHVSKDISEEISEHLSDDLVAWHFSDSDSVDPTEVTFVEGKVEVLFQFWNNSSNDNNVPFDMKLENGLNTLISESPLMTVYKSNSVSIRPQVTYLEDLYRKKFYQNVHLNFYGISTLDDSKRVIISVLKSIHKDGYYNALEIDQRGCFEFQIFSHSLDGKIKEIWKSIEDFLNISRKPFTFQYFHESKISKKILQIEEKFPQNPAAFKIAILYSNGSENTFKDFYQHREEIELKGWKKFRGDFSNHLTDSLKTYYTEWNGIEMLMDSEQQRRLIGNDITYLFFHDSQEPFPTSLVNGFGQVPQMFLVVQKIKDSERYRFGIVGKDNVKNFSPQISSQYSFCSQDMKDLILSNAFNGTFAAMKSPPMNRLYEIPRLNYICEVVDFYQSLSKKELRSSLKNHLRVKDLEFALNIQGTSKLTVMIHNGTNLSKVTHDSIPELYCKVSIANQVLKTNSVKMVNPIWNKELTFTTIGIDPHVHRIKVVIYDKSFNLEKTFDLGTFKSSKYIGQVEIPISSIGSKKKRRESISNNINKSNLQSSICYEVRGESPTDDISGKLFVNFKIQGPGKAPCPICGIFIGDADRVNFPNHVMYHQSCMKCVECGNSEDIKRVKKRDDVFSFYCSRHLELLAPAKENVDSGRLVKGITVDSIVRSRIK